MTKTLYDCINESVNYIKKSTDLTPTIGIVLGTGWQYFPETLDSARIYKDIPHFPIPTVEGHKGTLIIGKQNNVNIICLKGRLHAYEEFPIDDVVYPIRIICKLGVSILVVTNAAGGISPEFSQGDYMLICDHINLMGVNPLKGTYDSNIGPRFIDMSEAYDRKLINIAENTLKDLNINVKKGVYAGVNGPSYETPSEVKMLRILGADVVGMSTIPEVIVARQMGVRVCGISCITNMAAGIKEEKINHDKVLTLMKTNEKKHSTI
ncbi:MAG: purine-nucleoside phosphorylase, partial [Candidatus Scalinduaceae bacterium]